MLIESYLQSLMIERTILNMAFQILQANLQLENYFAQYFM